MSADASMGPSGTPSSTEVSTSDRTSSSESDKSSSTLGAIYKEHCQHRCSNQYEQWKKMKASEKHEWYNFSWIFTSSYYEESSQQQSQTRHLKGSSNRPRFVWEYSPKYLEMEVEQEDRTKPALVSNKFFDGARLMGCRIWRKFLHQGVEGGCTVPSLTWTCHVNLVDVSVIISARTPTGVLQHGL